MPNSCSVALVIISIFAILFIISILPVWGVKFRLPGNRKWYLAEKTRNLSYWGLKFGITKTKYDQPWLAVFHNCANIRWRISAFWI